MCDPTRPQDCLTYCYVMEDGSMVRLLVACGKADHKVALQLDAQGQVHGQVCEGLPSGEYEIKSAGPEDIEVHVCDIMLHAAVVLYALALSRYPSFVTG